MEDKGENGNQGPATPNNPSTAVPFDHSQLRALRDQQEQALKGLGGLDAGALMGAFRDQQEQALKGLGGLDAGALMRELNDQQEQTLKNIGGGIPALFQAIRSNYANLTAARSLQYPPLKSVDTGRSQAYSLEMTRSSTYFEQYESVVDSFEAFQREISTIMGHHPDFRFLWRGQRDADWPLHSSLFRELWAANGVRAPHETHRTYEPFPTEKDMVMAEASILEHVRENWRFDDDSAMSTFARLQHFGAPTRLLDVSRNPLIAAWFATEANEETNDKDCRIFALATATMPGDNLERERQEQGSKIGRRDASHLLPFWHALETDTTREDNQWGTGRLRRFWIPPLYESRISAQNAAFILDGVPLDSPDLDKYFLKPGGKDPWTIADRLAGGSISVRFSRPGRPVGTRVAKQLPPSFTIRVTAEAKREIRRILHDQYSYSRATIYPDIQGAAEAIRAELKDLLLTGN